MRDLMLLRVLIVIIYCVLFFICSTSIIPEKESYRPQEVSMYELYIDMKDSSVTVKSVNLSVDNLKPGYIIHFKNNAGEFFGYLKNISGSTLIIESKAYGDIVLNKEEFTGHVIILNKSVDFQEISNDEMKFIKGRFI